MGVKGYTGDKLNAVEGHEAAAVAGAAVVGLGAAGVGAYKLLSGKKADKKDEKKTQGVQRDAKTNKKTEVVYTKMYYYIGGALLAVVLLAFYFMSQKAEAGSEKPAAG